MKHFFSIFLIAVTLFSCGESQVENSTSTQTELDSIVFGLKAYKFPSLNKNAQEYTNTWSPFDEFQNDATTFRDLRLAELKFKTDNLLTHTDSLVKTIPDTLNTSAITSRLVIINTRVHLLKQETTKTQATSKSIEGLIEELNKATDHLLHQINEKFEKDNIDNQKIDNEKKELEIQKRYFDSIQKIELQDQKKKTTKE